jgi:hypothetical protein
MGQNNTLATVKREIHQAENPTSAVVIRVEAARVDNAILPGYLTYRVMVEEPEIGSTHPNILIANNCTDDEPNFVMHGDYEDERGGIGECNAIPTASRRRRPATELERFDLGSSDVNRYEGADGDDVDADADEEEEGSQANDGSKHNVED